MKLFVFLTKEYDIHETYCILTKIYDIHQTYKKINIRTGLFRLSINK